MLNKIIENENELVFNSFNNEDALRLGQIMIEIGRKYKKPIAVRVFINNYIAYQFLMEGTTDFHCGWMDRKQNLVERTHKSSLRCAIEQQFADKKMKWWDNEEKYAFCGGGFPIRIQNKYIGVAIVSGLTDIQDNAIAVEAIKTFLKTK